MARAMRRTSFFVAMLFVGCSAEVRDESMRDGASAAPIEEMCEPGVASADPEENCAAYCAVYDCAGCDNRAACEARCVEAVAAWEPTADCRLELLACATEHLDAIADHVSCDEAFENMTITFPEALCRTCD
jgi:hypothetical protein